MRLLRTGMLMAMWLLCVVLVLWAALLGLGAQDAGADVYRGTHTTAVSSIYRGTHADEVCQIYRGADPAPVYDKAGASAPAISGFGAHLDGSAAGNVHTLTVPRASLPATVVVSAASLARTTAYTLTRTLPDGTSSTPDVGAEPGPHTSQHYDEALTATFRPDSRGWQYTLEARNSAVSNCGSRHATAIVRTVAPPTLTALTASPPASSQGPFTLVVCSSVDWTATAGDPAAAWSWSQTGYHVAHLPSERNSAPGRGPQRVCIPEAPGQSTTLTLNGANEAGAASRSVTIPWPGTP